jgi:hypothetical protein
VMLAFLELDDIIMGGDGGDGGGGGDGGVGDGGGGMVGGGMVGGGSTCSHLRIAPFPVFDCSETYNNNGTARAFSDQFFPSPHLHLSRFRNSRFS